MRRIQVSATIAREYVDRQGYAHDGTYVGSYANLSKMWRVCVDGVGGLHSFYVRADSLSEAKTEANYYCSSRPQYDASIDACVVEVLKFTRKPSTFQEVGQ